MKSINKIAALLMTAAAIFAVNSCDSNGSGTEDQKDETVEIKISSITSSENSASVSGTVKVGKDVPAGTAIGIEYSANEAFPINDRTKVKINADSEGKFTVEIKNLNSDTDYYARTYVCKDGKTYDYGTPQKFHTAKATTGGGDEGGEQQGENNVVVTIDKIEGYVSEILVTVSVSENPAGAKYGLQISSESDFDAQYTAETLFTPDASLKTTLGVKNLTVGATYYTKAYCTLNGKTNWSQARSFTVQPDPVTSTVGISQPYVHQIGPRGRISADITWPENDAGYEFGAQISKTESFEYPVYKGKYYMNTTDDQSRYSVSYPTLLSPSTTYYARNYMDNNGKVTYSDVVSFKTEDLPVLSKKENVSSKTVEITVVLSDMEWVTLVTKKDFAEEIKYGLEISTDGTNFTDKVYEDTNIALSNSLDGYAGRITTPEVLTPNTKYYFRAFYTMNGGARIYQATAAGNFTTTE
ncbi:MAG: hypothetical protein PUC61_00725 [Bacteroidales bacterium]|nr:hypothetical protein [Bacteroidales bacterium]MDD6809280.1 hypothetical protein [Bacteroidales bacterium]